MSRASFTMRQILHGASPTREFLWIWVIASSPLCGTLNSFSQLALHLFRDCTSTKKIWLLLLPLNTRLDFFFFLFFFVWVMDNLQFSSFEPRHRTHWKYIYRGKHFLRFGLTISLVLLSNPFFAQSICFASKDPSKNIRGTLCPGLW